MEEKDRIKPRQDEVRKKRTNEGKGINEKREEGREREDRIGKG